jgi:ABC-type glucose/galactose transport system permease subunit
METLQKVKNFRVKAKRGFAALRLLPTVAIALVVGGLVISYGADISSDIAADQTSGSTEKAVSDNVTDAMNNLGKKLPSLATISAAGIIIAVLIGAFAFAYGKGR